MKQIDGGKSAFDTMSGGPYEKISAHSYVKGKPGENCKICGKSESASCHK